MITAPLTNIVKVFYSLKTVLSNGFEVIQTRVNSRFKAFIVMQRKNISLYNEILSLLSAHRSRLICTNRLNVETVQTHTTTFIILFNITPNIFHKSNPRCKCSICRFSTFSYIHKITE